MDRDEFVGQCLQRLAQKDPAEKIAELIESVMNTPAGLREFVDEPEVAKIEPLYVSESITILNVVWAPKMSVFPHNHNVWAVIGVYQGREDNIFWRRSEGDPERIEAAGVKTLCEGDVGLLGKNIIHTVTNPLERCTGAIHVYGGDIFAQPRSEWSPETLLEAPFNAERNARAFTVENALNKVRKELNKKGKGCA